MAVPLSVSFKRYAWPKSLVARFVTRRTIRGALIWALVFGFYVASKAIGFADLYPTQMARQKIAETFGSNIGIELILGQAPWNATTAAYVAWNTGSVIVLMGSIWGLLLAARYFRGEEDAGRTEILLAGQTTPRRAAVNTLLGIGGSLIAFFLVLSAILTAVGRSRGVDFSGNASLFFALTMAIGISLFVSIGALASQLMQTRSKAASVSAMILGLFFLMRAIGDVTSAHWLLNLTPLGWLEKAQPLSKSQPLWLIPPVALILVCLSLTVYFAGKRDLGESIISDKSATKAHFGLLKSPTALAVRLTRAGNIGWLVGVFIAALLYGLITKSTAQIFSASKGFEKVIHRLAATSKLSSTLAFLGVVFLLQMVLVMVYAANSVIAIRREEASGYLDNFLVHPYGRLRWLAGRLGIVGIMMLLAAWFTILGVWLGILSQHTGIGFHTLVLASINALVPAVILVGVGILGFALYPRSTSILAFAVLAWSLLIDLAASGLKLNHWLLDTSVLHQVVLAPSVNPNWSVNLVIVGLALILILVGGLWFNHRDLEGE